MPAVTGLLFEIEFTAGVWTDITQYVDLEQLVTIRSGRTSEYSPPQASTLDFILDNQYGRFTPLSQVLTDPAATPHPYYPNVVPLRRIRVSYSVGGVPQYRYFGYIKSWQPMLEGGMRGYLPISAVDRLIQLSQGQLRQSYIHEVLLDTPFAFYLFDGPEVGTTANGFVSIDQSPGNGNSGQWFSSFAGGGVATLGSALPLPVPDGLTGLQFTGNGTISRGASYCVPLALDPTTLGCLEGWMAVSGGTPTNSVQQTTAVQNADTLGLIAVIIVTSNGTNGRTAQFAASIGSFTYTGIDDGQPHHYAMTRSGTNWSCYVDGALVGLFAAGFVTSATRANLMVETDVTLVNGMYGVQGPVSVYVGSPSAARIAAHSAAGYGNVNELTGARIARVLSYAGLTSAEWNIDAGREVCSASQSTLGQDVLSFCQAVAETEGNGAAFYIGPAGRARFCDRAFRKAGAPTLTLVSGNDIEPGTFTPSLDGSTLVTRCTVTSAQGSQTFIDTAAETSLRTVVADSATSYASTAAAALYLAQSRVRTQSTPGYRVSKVSINLLTAQSAGLYAALVNVEIGSRIRITGLPPGLGVGSQVDVIVEGRTETIGNDRYLVEFDTSPADSPAFGIWDDTVYGRYQAVGATLNGAITNAATTLSIATVGPVFTSVGARYPMSIKIGQEVITLNNAPGGSVSPQTFTGVTRGTNGSPAAAQAAGSTVNLWPASTFAL